MPREDIPMSLGLLCLCLSASVAADPAPEALPLLAGEKSYQQRPELERVFEGVLERNPSEGRIGAAPRCNAFRLSWIDGAGHAGGREIYLPDKAHLIAGRLGQRLRLVGKAVDTEVGGKTYLELWPARLELPGTAAVVSAPASVDGVLARCYWQPAAGSPEALKAGRPGEPRLYVFRDGRSLVSQLRLSGSGAEEAAGLVMAKKLGVPAIDWDRQMLVGVSAGLKGADAERLTITRVAVADRVMTLYYRLESPPGGAAGFGYPAETALVERFDGEVRLQADPGKAGPSPAP
jgi:hypothetical protein